METAVEVMLANGTTFITQSVEVKDGALICMQRVPNPVYNPDDKWSFMYTVRENLRLAPGAWLAFRRVTRNSNWEPQG